MKLGKTILLAAACAPLMPSDASADDLYRRSRFAAMAADRRAAERGDLLTILIQQSAESVNSAQSNAGRSSDIGGSIGAGPIDERARLSFGSSHRGGGELRRSERFVAQVTVTVTEVLPNGDLIVTGDQWLDVNGNRTLVGIQGRVRPDDIGSNNTIPSVRVADARINYNGRGFVARSARPGLISRIFSFLGL